MVYLCLTITAYLIIFISNLEYVLYWTFWYKLEVMYLIRQNRYTRHKTLNNYPKYIYGKSAYKRDDVFDFIWIFSKNFWVWIYNNLLSKPFIFWNYIWPQRLNSTDTYILPWLNKSRNYFNSNPDHLWIKRDWRGDAARRCKTRRKNIISNFADLKWLVQYYDNI